MLAKTNSRASGSSGRRGRTPGALAAGAALAGLSGLAFALGVACGAPRKEAPARKPSCAAAPLSEALQGLRALCAASRSALSTATPGLAGQALATAEIGLQARLPPAPLVTLTPERALLDGTPLEGWKEILAVGDPPLGPAGAIQPEGSVPPMRQAVVSRLRKVRPAARDGQPEVHLAIAPEVPATAVRSMLVVLWQAGYGRVSLLLRPATVPRVPRVVDASASTGSPGARGTAANPAARQAALDDELAALEKAGCSQVGALRARLGAGDRQARCDGVVDALPRALAVCGCPRDPRALVARFQQTLEPLDFVGSHAVTLAPTADGVKAPGPGSTWQDLARAAATLDRPFWISGLPLPRVDLPGGATLRAEPAMDEVRKVVRAAFPQFRSCYTTQALVDDPRLAGTVKITAMILWSGVVETAEVSQTTLAHARTEACIVRAFKALRFPDGSFPGSNKGFLVTYPFVFQPDPPPSR